MTLRMHCRRLWRVMCQPSSCHSSCVRLATSSSSSDTITRIHPLDRRLLFGRDIDESDKNKTGTQNRRRRRAPVTRNSTSTVRLAQLLGVDGESDIVELLTNVAKDKCRAHVALMDRAVRVQWNPMPPKFRAQPGWTRYSLDGSQAESVSHPECELLVLDVEVCTNDSMAPVIAVAASPDAWYSWCSERLFTEDVPDSKGNEDDDFGYRPSDMLPLGRSETRERIVIGHHIGYDRARIREQYDLRPDKTRFWDTMSMHICVRGMTSEQIADFRKYTHPNFPMYKSKPLWMETWTKRTCKNALADVHQFYCPSAPPLNKEPREIFVKGTLQDVQKNLDMLLLYCADDVRATVEVFRSLWPEFKHRFPHPITHFGMLEIGTGFLPVTSNWRRFVSYADEAKTDRELTVRKVIDSLAKERLHKWRNAASAVQRRRITQQDPWMFDVDWTAKPRPGTRRARGTKLEIDEAYPKWYLDLFGRSVESLENITMGSRLIPRLLRLCWDGVPLYFDRECYWCYPDPLLMQNWAKTFSDETEFWIELKGLRSNVNKRRIKYPFWSVFDVIRQHPQKQNDSTQKLQANYDFVLDWRGGYRQRPSLYSYIQTGQIKIGLHKLPHPNGANYRVGNPIARSFLSHLESGRLASENRDHALSIARSLRESKYWHSNEKRVKEQLVVWQQNNPLRPEDKLGAIVPQLCVSGTVTRRCVEKLWMTVSNPKADRIGSELKSLIEAPPGFVLVGADVDSQEQWIAALLGDSYIVEKNDFVDRSPGQTQFGKMLLVGSKEKGTDLHSVVAKELGIKRNQAKVLNYGRLYGAGAPYAKSLLSDYLPNSDRKVIDEKTDQLYKSTKGKKSWKLEVQTKSLRFRDHRIEHPSWIKHENGVTLIDMSSRAPNKILFMKKNGLPTTWRKYQEAVKYNVPLPLGTRMRHKWKGGYESEVFNCLENIAFSENPVTPALGCPLSDALTLPLDTPGYNDFLGKWGRSRVNWVVQSSAVDFLHVLLTCIALLRDRMRLDARFCISVHDEIRYLVRERDRYVCAYAMHLSNLCARAFFSKRLGVDDLPQSVAYFSQVDIDRVFRKEPTLDCVTPSNPDGLRSKYGIPFGEAVTYAECLEKMTEQGFGDCETNVEHERVQAL